MPIFLATTPEIADLLLAKGAQLHNANNTATMLQAVQSQEMLEWCVAHGLSFDAPAPGGTLLNKLVGKVGLDMLKWYG